MKNNKTAPLTLPSDVPDVAAGPVYALERFLARQILHFVGNAPITLVLWNGEEVSATDTRKVGRVHIRDRGALWKLCLNADLYFGDLYSVERVDIEGDFVRSLEAVYAGSADTPATGAIKHVRRAMNRPRRNTLD